MSINTRVVLDTSAYSHLRVGHSAVVDSLARADTVVVPAVVVGELEAGFLLGKRVEENRRTLAEFLDEPFVNILDVSAVTARRYGQIFAALRLAGTPIPINDIWIAAATMECGGHLLTFDVDFSRISGLEHTVLAIHD